MSKRYVLLTLLAVALMVSCNNDDDTTPVPTTPTMTATETALLGLWTWDKTEAWTNTGADSITAYKVYTDSSDGYRRTYNANGTVSGTMALPYNHESFDLLSTVYTSTSMTYAESYNVTPYSCNYQPLVGTATSSYWFAVPNMGGTGKIYLMAGSRIMYIYTLTTSQIISRSSTLSSLYNVQIYYYHKGSK